MMLTTCRVLAVFTVAMMVGTTAYGQSAPPQNATPQAQQGNTPPNGQQTPPPAPTPQPAPAAAQVDSVSADAPAPAPQACPQDECPTPH